MKIKLNGNTQIPIFGLGTFRNNERDVVIQTILTALKIGYRHIDTAKAYKNEKYIGEAIKLSNVKREDLFITSKVKIHPNDNLVANQIDDSLNQLQVDYLDLVLIHWPSEDYKLNYQTYKILESYYKVGKIKAIGVSNFLPNHLNELLKVVDVKPVINQVELHPGLNQLELELFLNKHNIVLQSYGPFMKGEVFKSPYKEVLEKIALKYNTTIAGIVIAWGISRNIVMIPMSTNPVNLLSNYRARNIKLSKCDIELINNLDQNKRVYSHPKNNQLFLYK